MTCVPLAEEFQRFALLSNNGAVAVGGVSAHPRPPVVFVTPRHVTLALAHASAWEYFTSERMESDAAVGFVRLKEVEAGFGNGPPVSAAYVVPLTVTARALAAASI